MYKASANHAACLCRLHFLCLWLYVLLSLYLALPLCLLLSLAAFLSLAYCMWMLFDCSMSFSVYCFMLSVSRCVITDLHVCLFISLISPLFPLTDLAPSSSFTNLSVFLYLFGFLSLCLTTSFFFFVVSLIDLSFCLFISSIYHSYAFLLFLHLLTGACTFLFIYTPSPTCFSTSHSVRFYTSCSTPAPLPYSHPKKHVNGL